MKAANIVSEILTSLSKHVEPGVNTFTLDCIAEQEIKRLGVASYNKGYNPPWSRYPYPNVSCISVNDTIAHGIPSESVILKEGDLVNIDLAIIDENGDCADAALSLPVGKISKEDEMLLRYAKKTLYAGISYVKAGAWIYDIARAMERKAAERNFVINHQLGGHKIGKQMHEEPTIYQVTNPYIHGGKDYEEFNKQMEIKLEAGWVICLEPILTFKDKWGIVDPETGWAVKTRDGRKSAMFEHMLEVTNQGCNILTSHI